jgi:hypothetical protein
MSVPHPSHYPHLSSTREKAEKGETWGKGWTAESKIAPRKKTRMDNGRGWVESARRLSDGFGGEAADETVRDAVECAERPTRKPDAPGV